jgi:hypothetical protein
LIPLGGRLELGSPQSFEAGGFDMVTADILFDGAGVIIGAGIPGHWATVLVTDPIKFVIITKNDAELLNVFLSNAKSELVVDKISLSPLYHW